MTTPRLTDRVIRSLVPTPAARELRDAGQPGLILRVLPSGRKDWSIRYRVGGRQRRYTLGPWPALSLAEARKRARKRLAQVADGRDPVAERRAARQPAADTVAALAALYLARHATRKKKPSSAQEDARIVRRDVLPVWGERSVRSLTRRDVRELVYRIAERAPVHANRVLALIRKLLNFAVDEEWIEANPAARLPKPTAETSRDRVLTDDEIRTVWQALTDERPPVAPRFAAMLRVLLLTAQRPGEVARMKWADVDVEAGWWTIPASDTKNGRTHRVYLTEPARAILRAFGTADGRTYVFGRAGDESPGWRAKKTASAVARACGVAFRAHDLRRTAATKMAEAGVPRAHLALVLNHTDGAPRATQVYDRYTHDREKQVALETWARRLEEILSGRPAATVVPFAR